MQWFLLVLRLACAAVFAISAAAKLATPRASRRAAADLGVPRPLAPILGSLLPFVELAVALALVVTTDARPGAIAATVLLLMFTALVSWNLARGRRPSCRCFGELRSAPISWRTLVRNAVLLTVAVTLVVAGGGRDPVELLTGDGGVDHSIST